MKIGVLALLEPRKCQTAKSHPLKLSTNVSSANCELGCLFAMLTQQAHSAFRQYTDADGQAAFVDVEDRTVMGAV